MQIGGNKLKFPLKYFLFFLTRTQGHTLTLHLLANIP